MYIINPEKIKNKIKTKGLISKYFIEQNIPVLSKDRDITYFADSELFRKALGFSPMWIKLLMKFS
jgi:hypothetical protein